MQSPSFFVTESDPRFSQQKQLTVTEAGRAVKLEADLPHLVSLGSGRFSTAVILHPLPEGKTTVGCMNADIIIRGRGIQPEHCYFIHDRNVVILFPISTLITVDGAKATRPTILSQGSMICFGRSSYFRFNHPAEAQHLKEEYFDIYSETYSTADVFSKREPLYANEEMSNSSATSTTEGSLSLTLYDNPNEVKLSGVKISRESSPRTIGSNVSSVSIQDFDRTMPRYREDFGTRSPPLGPFQPNLIPYSVFPDGSQRAVVHRYNGVARGSTPDYFDEKASHIPRPVSPLVEGLTFDNWTGYDNVLELKESIKKLQAKDEAKDPSGHKEKSNTDEHQEPEAVSPADAGYASKSSVESPSEVFSPIATPVTAEPLMFLCIEKSRSVSPKSDQDSVAKKQTTDLLDKRKVTFYIKEDKASDANSTNDDVARIDVATRPPSGRQSFEQLKKHENKREKRFVWSKRDTYTGDGAETLPAKPSFFRSLIRSRSPSPSSKRSPSPAPEQYSDVARRLSEPLKKSFKNPDPSIKDKFLGLKLSCESSSSDEEASLHSLHTSPSPSTAVPNHSKAAEFDTKNTTQDYHDSNNNGNKTSHVNTTDDEKSRSNLPAEQQPVASNPWKVNLKTCNMNDYKGEKLFSRDTVTTNIAIPRPSDDQRSRSDAGDPEGGSQSVAKPSAEVQPLMKPSGENPIYDCVYEAKRDEGAIEDNLLPGAETSDFTEDVLEFIDMITSGRRMSERSQSNRAVVDGKTERDGMASRNDANNNSRVTTTNSSEASLLERNVPASGIVPETFSDRSNRADAKTSTSFPTSTAHVVSSVNIGFLSSNARGNSPSTRELSKITSVASDNNKSFPKKSQIAPHYENTVDLLGVNKHSPTTSRDNSVSPTPRSSSANSGSRIHAIGNVVSKPPLRENVKQNADEEMAALFGVRMGVLQRIKTLKQKIEEIEEKERNIESLITRNSLNLDVLEGKHISEQDIRDFFSNAKNALDSLDEEGKRVESQFVEANEYLGQINKTIGDIKKRKGQKVNDSAPSASPPNVRGGSGIFGRDPGLPKPTVLRKGGRDSHTALTEVKVSSGSESSSLFGSATLLDKSAAKTKDSNSTLSEKNLPSRNSTCRPLTRYFPVTDSSFDLRCYIESSGHNLDVCKTVHVESYRCSGYLSKMGRKWKKWHRRWFVFDRTRRHLACYLDEPHSPNKQHQQPRSAYYFQSIRDVFADHLHMVKSPNPDFTFCIKLVDKNLFLMSSSADAMRIWIDVLFTGAEAYQEVS